MTPFPILHPPADGGPWRWTAEDLTALVEWAHAEAGGTDWPHPELSSVADKQAWCNAWVPKWLAVLNDCPNTGASSRAHPGHWERLLRTGAVIRATTMWSDTILTNEME